MYQPSVSTGGVLSVDFYMLVIQILKVGKMRRRVRISIGELRNRLRQFGEATGGTIAVIFALAAVPMMTFTGAAVDYSRASATKEDVQVALDSALMGQRRQFKLGQCCADCIQCESVGQNYFGGNAFVR